MVPDSPGRQGHLWRLAGGRETRGLGDAGLVGAFRVREAPARVALDPWFRDRPELCSSDRSWRCRMDYDEYLAACETLADAFAGVGQSVAELIESRSVCGKSRRAGGRVPPQPASRQRLERSRRSRSTTTPAIPMRADAFARPTQPCAAMVSARLSPAAQPCALMHPAVLAPARKALAKARIARLAIGARAGVPALLDALRHFPRRHVQAARRLLPGQHSRAGQVWLGD